MLRFHCEGSYLQQDRLRKTQKIQFHIVEKDVYRTSGEISEAFIDTDDDLTMNDAECFKIVER